MKLKIGVDIDEVLSDTVKSILQYHNEVYRTNFEFSQVKDYDFWKLWGGTKEEAIKKVHDFYILGNFKKLKPFPEAIESINSLKEHSLSIITARHDYLKEDTITWINSYFPDIFSGIYFADDFSIKSNNGKRKSLICRELTLNLMLEDYPDCALECAQKGINVLLFDKPWNKNTQHREITRVSSWQEALQAINSLEIYK